MHTHGLSLWQHSHNFGTQAQQSAERRTHWVVGLTFAVMLVELTADWLTGSMALLAEAFTSVLAIVALGGCVDKALRYADPTWGPRTRVVPFAPTSGQPPSPPA